MKVPQVVVIRNAGVGVDLHAHLVHGTVQEEPAVGIEDLRADNREELSGHASCIQGWLAEELEPSDI